MSIFAPMLRSVAGTPFVGLQMPSANGKARLVTFKTEADKDTAYGEKERQENLQKIRNAIGAGIYTRVGLKEATKLSFMTLSRRLSELIDDDEVVKDDTKKPCEWRFK